MPIDIERFTKVPLFEGLEPDDIAKLLQIAEDVTTEPGDIIVREGDPGDGFYVIGDGVFDVIRGGENENVMARMEALSFFGEMSLVSGAPRAATVRCVEAGRLKRFGLDDFNGLLERDNLQAYKVIRNMAHILAERFDKLGKRFVAEILDAAAGH